MAASTSVTQPKKKSGILNAHWKKSGIIAGPFLLGILLIVAHDQVYAHYNGKPVSSQTQQQWVGRIGTGFAFLIKKLFSTAVGAACVQMLWWILRNKSTSIKTIDSTFSIVHNPFALKNFRLFTEAPVIVFMAAIAWFMPIAAVIAPPTLTVLPNTFRTTSTENMKIPAINWTIKYDESGSNNGNRYSGVQPGIQRVAMQVALASQELTFSPPGDFKNGSYSTSFYGPAVECEQANQTWYDAASAAADAARVIQESGVWYLSWIPYNVCASSFLPGASSTSYQLTNLTVYLTSSMSNDCNNPNSPSYETVDGESVDAAQIFIATWNQPEAEPLRVYKCSLHNASYEVNFNFTNGISAYKIQQKTLLNPVAYADASNSFVDVNYVSTPPRGYLALMDALGKILIGYVTTFEFETSINELRTIILKTPLIETSDFSSALSNLGFGDVAVNSTTKTLGTAVEEMMTNLTISLFSQSHFLATGSGSPFADVSIVQLENEYSYDRWQLWTAYGLGAVFTLISIAIGFWCMHATEAAYSNTFSTMMRVTRDSDFSGLIMDQDTSGADPRPSYLSDVKLRLEPLPATNGADARCAVTFSQNSTRREQAGDGVWRRESY